MKNLALTTVHTGMKPTTAPNPTVGGGGGDPAGEYPQRLPPLRLHDAVQLRRHLAAPAPVRVQLVLSIIK